MDKAGPVPNHANTIPSKEGERSSLEVRLKAAATRDFNTSKMTFVVALGMG
jgi:hypothetical protein